MANLKDRFKNADQRQEERYQSNTAKRDTVLADPSTTEKEREELIWSQNVDNAIRNKNAAEAQGIHFTGAPQKSEPVKVNDSAKALLDLVKAYDDTLPSDKGSKYLTTVDRLFERIAGDAFRYDAKSDPRYTLAEEYAKRGMEEQMAESALLTGGYGNSFGAAAGQKVYTDYMDRAVNDMEDRAYAKWSAERDNAYNLLGIARDMEQQQYERGMYEQEKADAAGKEAKTAAQVSVQAYIDKFGTIDGLTEEELAATGWSENDLKTKVAVAQDAINGKTAEDAKEETAKYDAIVEQYYTMGLTVPEEILAKSSYAGQRDLVDGYSGYYKTKIGNENTMEKIDIAKGYKSLEDTSAEEERAKNDSLVEMYIAAREMPPADLIAASNYAGHDALISRKIEGVDGTVEPMSAEETEKAIMDYAKKYFTNSNSYSMIPGFVDFLREAMTAEDATINGASGMKKIVDNMRTAGIIDDIVKGSLYRSLGLE